MMPSTKARISGRLFSRRVSDVTIILRFCPIRPPFRLICRWKSPLPSGSFVIGKGWELTAGWGQL